MKPQKNKEKRSKVMGKNERDDLQISGKYKHFKGKHYDLFCVAYGRGEEKYVLYQQCYGDKSFWIRPYEMFFDHISDNGTDTLRFSPTTAPRQKAANKIDKLHRMIEAQTIRIKHTESEEEYIITAIDRTKGYVIIYPVNAFESSGYLTDFELMKRLGFTACSINGQPQFFKSTPKINERQALTIGRNDIELLRQHINPCSIDLQIDDSGYIRTKRCLVNPQSVEIVWKPERFWKPVKIHKSKHGLRSYIKLGPGKTVLSRTKERIRIPSDCAAKIEIKSTFARLSLDITSGDFCNPGYYGHFPLEITNKGKHTIVLHQGETMAQLMLIPLSGPILEDYCDKATYRDGNEFDGGGKTFDDGTPYSFWRERAIKQLRKEEGTQSIIELFYVTRDRIDADNTTDIAETQKRFDETFLSFCWNRIKHGKYMWNGQPDKKALFLAYVAKEKRLKRILALKWVTGAGALVSVFASIFKLLYKQKQENLENSVIAFLQSFPLWLFIMLSVALLIITILLFLRWPRVFCTFERINIETLCEEAENRTRDQQKSGG